MSIARVITDGYAALDAFVVMEPGLIVRRPSDIHILMVSAVNARWRLVNMKIEISF
jgi:hypothetical protein